MSSSTPAAHERLPTLVQMAGPLVVSFWMRAAFTFVDTAFAATLGDAAVGAIGLTVPFEFLMIAAWVGLSTGFTSRLSAAMGAREGQKIEQYKRAISRMVLVVAPLFALIGVGIWFGTPHLGLEADLATEFRTYGTVLMTGSAFTAFWSVRPDSIVKAHQDTRSTMWAGILSNVLNVALNALFLFVFEWGIFGIALSTVLGRIGGLGYALWRAKMHEDRRQAAGNDTVAGLDPAPYRSMFALSIPASLTFAFIAAEGFLINGLLAAAPHSQEAIAGYSIYNRVVLFAINPVIAFGVALLPYTARRFGLGDLRAVRRGLRQAGWLSVAYCVLVAPVLYFAAPSLSAWLAEAELTAEYATIAVRLTPLACLVTIPFMLSRPVFEGLGRGTPGLVMAVVRYVVLAVPMAWGGMRVGEAYGWPAVAGLVAGLIVASLIVGVAFGVWLEFALSAIKPDVATEPES